MNYQQIISLIPQEYRTEILSLNAIANAQAVMSDGMMMLLGKVWVTYVDSNQSLSCPPCLEKVLKNFRELEPTMIEMEKQNNLLDLV